MPFFSVIIPAYNSQTSIAHAMQSVLNQSFSDFEVLLMDAASTDGTLAIAKGFSDERISIFSETDKGPYDAMNKGILRAKGEWLYFLGSDDSLRAKNVLQKVSDYIASSPGSVVYGNVFVKGNTAWANDGDIYDGLFTIKKLMQKNICHQSIFYKKCIFSKIGLYNLKYKICADYDFNLRAAAKCNFDYLDCIIADFNAGGYSTQYLKDICFEDDKRKNIITYFSRYINKEDFSQFQPYISAIAKHLFIKGQVFKAFELIFRKALIKLNFMCVL